MLPAPRMHSIEEDLPHANLLWGAVIRKALRGRPVLVQQGGPSVGCCAVRVFQCWTIPHCPVPGGPRRQTRARSSHAKVAFPLALTPMSGILGVYRRPSLVDKVSERRIVAWMARAVAYPYRTLKKVPFQLKEGIPSSNQGPETQGRDRDDSVKTAAEDLRERVRGPDRSTGVIVIIRIRRLSNASPSAYRGRRGMLSPGQPADCRASNAFTFETCQAPPRRVRMPRSVSSAAMARSEAFPWARMSAITVFRRANLTP